VERLLDAGEHLPERLLGALLLSIWVIEVAREVEDLKRCETQSRVPGLAPGGELDVDLR
jgi:hypothetical protein